MILSGGTYGSAGILLRSGVGPWADLRSLDIEVVADVPVAARQTIRCSPPFMPSRRSTSR